MTSTLDPAEIPEYPMTRAAGCPFDPPPGLKTAQQAGPLAKVRLEDGRTFWLVTRYADQRAVLASSKVSSDLRTPGYPQPMRDIEASGGSKVGFILMDDPEHARLRRMVT